MEDRVGYGPLCVFLSHSAVRESSPEMSPSFSLFGPSLISRPHRIGCSLISRAINAEGPPFTYEGPTTGETQQPLVACADYREN